MLERLPVKKLTGDECFINTPNKQFSVSEFWRYGFSNLNSNVLRGALAEFIVENALKENKEITVRNPWGDWDVLSPNGKKIEVKCSSYIQDWKQNDFSKIIWSGLKAKTLYFSSAVSTYPREPEDYKSDIYVLSLFKHKDPETLNILDINQWCFWVLSKEEIKTITKDKNSISINRLEKASIQPVSFGQLREEILKR
jgi:hypothetical protein